MGKTIAATSGGKRLTLDPVGEKNEVALEVWEVETTLAAGLRQSWIDGENDESEVELLCGAGLGSPWGIFHYTRKSDGAEVQMVFDGGDLLSSLAALAEKKIAERTDS